MKMLLGVLVLCVLIAPVFAAVQTNPTPCPLNGTYGHIYHVAPWGRNTNPGTEYAPFRDRWFAEKKWIRGDLIILHK